MKKEKLHKLILLELMIIIMLAAIHLFLLSTLLPDIYFTFNVIYIYLFFTCFSLLGIYGIFLIQKNDETLIGKGFLALIVIKLFASITFLLPFLLDQDESTRPFIYQFFAVFFPVLIIETFIILQMVKHAELKKLKKQENL
ncbi:MAG: hypothetical protein AB8B72_00425 [Crocinitomicaceae bacterium]